MRRELRRQSNCTSAAPLPVLRPVCIELGRVQLTALRSKREGEVFEPHANLRVVQVVGQPALEFVEVTRNYQLEDAPVPFVVGVAGKRVSRQRTAVVELAAGEFADCEHDDALALHR